MPTLFVTGTDTGVGKTTVCLALLAAAAARGLRTAAFKPAESGCVDRQGRLVPGDAEALAAACNPPLSVDDVCLYALAAPLAPGVAAERVALTLDFDRIATQLAALESRRADLLVVEGAGGLLVPWGAGRTTRDLVNHLGLDLLVVARDSLGTINHTCLTLEAAQSAGIRVVGFIFSATGRASPSDARDNADRISTASGCAFLGTLPRVESFEPSALGRAAAGLDLDRLLRST